MTPLSREILYTVRNSPWLDPYALDCLRLNECTEAYQIIERVLVNVAAKKGRTWKDIYFARRLNIELFSELCVALILIDAGLRTHLKFEAEEVDEVLGAKHSQIIRNYYQLMGKKI
jgi:hypothetical protein